MGDDEQLVAQALAGRDAAFSELVDRYQARVLRFLVTRSASLADAEDALQDTLMNAYRYLASFDPRWRFSTWLYRIAIRAAAKQPRAQWSPAADAADPAADPLAACIVAGERENLWLTARRVLPGDMYTAMWLFYVEELTLKEVGQALDRSLPWVKVTLYRGRNRLQHALREQPARCKESKAYG
ncbi:MAG TPA: sigma-70 family RNA polymerase sigma factor [Woeseiaceae bacterium]|nr:sigma-70 family RNA polymerase sigma factor [Woeseiaceae bacterium]